LGSLASSISGDYFTEAFHQVVAMLGGKGRFISSLGITSLIARKLKISLTTEMVSEITQFARPVSENFDNRKQIAGCFSSAALQDLTRGLELRELQTTTTISQLLKQSPTSLKTKQVTGYGHGHGVAGILTQATINKMEGVGAMGGASRARIPRAFPNNSISKFDETLAAAQTLIIKQAGFIKERIRLEMKCVASHRFICFTDTMIVFFTPDAGAIKQLVRIHDVRSVASSEGEVTLVEKGKQAIVIQAKTAELAGRIHWFVRGQARMIRLYKESWLL
jgi:hypothetical protein